jgi:hypothetical protein
MVSCKSGKIPKTQEYTITLFVNTKTLDVEYPETSCRFEVVPQSANRTPCKGDKVKKFKVKVKLNGENPVVNWMAESEADVAEQVAVKEILHVGGPNVFEVKELKGVNGKVTGIAKKKTFLKAYRYYLHFTVGNSDVEYIIDPKLMVK